MKQIVLLILGLVFTQNIWAQNTSKVKSKSPYLVNEYAEPENNKRFSSPHSAKKTSSLKTASFFKEEDSRESLLTRIAEVETTIEKQQGNTALVEKLNARLISLRTKLDLLEPSLPHTEKDK